MPGNSFVLLLLINAGNSFVLVLLINAAVLNLLQALVVDFATSARGDFQSGFLSAELKARNLLALSSYSRFLASNGEL